MHSKTNPLAVTRYFDGCAQCWPVAAQRNYMASTLRLVRAQARARLLRAGVTPTLARTRQVQYMCLISMWGAGRTSAPRTRNTHATAMQWGCMYNMASNYPA
jgi:hypothetical protein